VADISLSGNASSRVSAGNRWKGRVSVLPDEVDDPEEFIRLSNKAVGSAVAAICKDRDLKQEDTADLLRVSTRQIRRMERGEAAYTLAQLQLIARKTKTTMAEILKLIDSWPSGERPASKHQNSK
jgi:ribosome-binding protein aMBF1 (putative translation factor)